VSSGDRQGFVVPTHTEDEFARRSIYYENEPLKLRASVGSTSDRLKPRNGHRKKRCANARYAPRGMPSSIGYRGVVSYFAARKIV